MFNVSLHAKSTTLVTFYCRYTYILKQVSLALIDAKYAN